MQGLSQYKCDKSVLSPVYSDWRSKICLTKWECLRVLLKNKCKLSVVHQTNNKIFTQPVSDITEVDYEL